MYDSNSRYEGEVSLTSIPSDKMYREPLIKNSSNLNKIHVHPCQITENPKKLRDNLILTGFYFISIKWVGDFQKYILIPQEQ